MRNQKSSRVPRHWWTGGVLWVALLILAGASSAPAAAEPPSVLSGDRRALKEVLRGVLAKGGKTLFHGGLGPFQEKARDRASQFLVDQNLGNQLEAADEAFVNELAEEVFDEFRVEPGKQVDAVDPELKSLEKSLRAILPTLSGFEPKEAASYEALEQNALRIALEMYRVKVSNPSAKPFEGANREFVERLTREVRKTREPAPPTPVPADNQPDVTPADVAGETSALSGQVRTDLVGVLRRMDRSLRLSQEKNVTTSSDDQRIKLLRDAVDHPNSELLRALKKLPAFQTLRSVTELSAADRQELSEKMIPEAVRANSAALVSPPIPDPQGDDSSNVDSDAGASVGVESYVRPGGPHTVTSVYDEVLVIDGSSLTPGCRLFRGPRRASRGTVLLRSPYRGRSSRSTTYYLVD